MSHLWEMPALASARSLLAAVPMGPVTVGVSGGKDSLVTLDLCIERFGKDNVSGFFMYLVEGLDFEWKAIRTVERRYGIKVHGVPHYELASLLRGNMYRPYVEGSEKIKLLKQKDVEHYVRATFGDAWFAYGMRASDSVVRNAYLKQCKGSDEKRRRVYPIAFWKKRDVYGYLHAKKMPVPDIIGGKKISGGLSLTPECLLWVYEQHPQDFKRIERLFPFVMAAVVAGRRRRAELAERKLATAPRTTP